ncbi:MAG: hypothetical protein A2808_01390 [Candidatus Moranbacteria bacterium RIFCSPHIGHO2_01_FULL_55_24]|nr:MAG: hypothetical protein A2808_01390 [Candidatus Moranbacteria bacterium RIFCSPHIGHO2_01_FULL_55_24]
MFRKKKPGAFHKNVFLPKRKEKRAKRGASEEKTGRPGMFFLSLFLWLVFLGTLGYLLLVSPLLLLERFSVSGNSRVSTEKLEDFFSQATSDTWLGVFSAKNYLLFRTEKFSAALLETYPEIRSARVEKRFPASLFLRVEEREAGVLWCSGGPCYLLDEENRTRESRAIIGLPEERLPVYTVIDKSGLPVDLGQPVFSYPFSTRLLALYSLLDERFGIKLEKESVTPSRFSDEVRFRAEGGYELYVNTSLEPQETIDSLALFFDGELPQEKLGELAYIDLRTENRIYYAFKNAPEEKKSEENKENAKDPKEGEKAKKKE